MEQQQYDDTDRGAIFKPKDTQQLVGSGKLNSNGQEEYHVFIKATLPDGRIIREIFKKVGVLFENENPNPKAPHLSGDYEDRRIAVWFAKSQSGLDYMDAKIGDKTPKPSIVDNSPNEYEQAKQGIQPLNQVMNNITEEPDLVDEIPF